MGSGKDGLPLWFVFVCVCVRAYVCVSGKNFMKRLSTHRVKVVYKGGALNSQVMQAGIEKKSKLNLVGEV